MDEEALAAAYARGLTAEKAGDAAAAASAYADCLALDPADRGGAAMRLAALGRAEAPARAAPAYVATLFDQHADAFERMLVDDLGYRTPWDMAATLSGLGRERFASVLDLGCGTGLLGEALEGRFGRLEGVDLSEGMLEIAGEKDLYDALHVGDAEGFLAADARRWSLIAAADVLPYLGALESLFAAVAARLEGDGLFVASCECGDAPEAAGWLVGPDQRFWHGRTYLERAFSGASLAPLGFAAITVRMQDGRPAPGWLFAARPA